MRVCTLALTGLLVLGPVAAQERVVAGEGYTISLDAAEGAAAKKLAIDGTNWAGGTGVAWEGFGVGSYYVPNRHLNESVSDAGNGIAYTYECDGPNITGLHAVRTLEPVGGARSLKVTWHIDHQGDEDQWVAPWVRHDLVPGGTLDDKDRIDVPGVGGIVAAAESAYHVAARNWVAATDPESKQSVCAIYDANRTHAFLTHRGPQLSYAGLQTAFLPFLMKPGDTWETAYVMTMVQGLTHVNFATEELAAQIDYTVGKLEVLIAGVQSLGNVSLHASLMEPNGRVVRLPEQRFDLRAGGVVRLTYDWTAPADGAYDFLALIKRDGANVELGRTVNAPHGGIDAQFVVGKAGGTGFEAWTDAPYALDRSPKSIARDMAVEDGAAIWIEPAMEKVFADDTPQPTGTIDNTVRLRMARNESESFQVVVRPPENRMMSVQAVRVSPLASESSSIAARNIQVYNVLHVPVPVPSYYEGPTGEWPDALLPFEPFDAAGGHNQPIWITVTTPEGTAPGVYTGAIEIVTEELGATPIGIELEVFDFALPRQPALKTDFGLNLARAHTQMQRFGYKGSEPDLRDRYFELASQARVTLRDTASFPPESPDYAAALGQFESRLAYLEENGATTHAVPESLMEFPELVQQVDAVVEKRGLENRAFTIVADEPKPAAWPRVFERIQQWRDTAPHVPVMVTTLGLEPFLHEAVNIWAVHLPVFDTPNNRTVLDRIKDGGEVWWYVNHSPPRPYGNFFLDFEAIEHRILFWQAWALGVKGFHYWAVSYAPLRDNPYKGVLDITPVNGDGLLLYPGPNGPVQSIRWETIRDGVEDYDYLVLFRERMQALEAQGGHEALLARVQDAYNLRDLIPSLVTFSQDPAVLQNKRAQIGQLIVEMDKALR